MKKLIPMIAGVACAITAFAAQKTPLTVSDFEALTPGNPLSMDGTMWTKAETDEAPVIATYEGSGTTAYTYGDQDTLTTTAVGNNYLAIETSAGPLFRNNDSDKRSIADEDLYIDTLVKFTVSDSDTEITAEGDAKLALWLQAGAEEGVAPSLKLCCGDLNADTKVLGKKTVTLNAGEITLNDTTWYRLTVRALKSAATDEMSQPIAAFKIFLNGNELAATDGTTEFLACVAGTELTAVGFKGNGGVDDVAFADESGAPSFAIPPVLDITVTWTVAEIAGLTAGDKVLTPEELAKGTIDVAPGTTFTVTFAKGYMGDASQKFDEAGAIVAQKVAFTDAEDHEFASLADAIARGQGKIMLAGAYTLAEEIVIESGDKVIDLAGATITINGINDSVAGDAFSVGDGGSLTIIDSVGGGKIVAAADQVASIIYNEGTVTIGSTEGFAPTFEGAKLLDGNAVSIIKGKFDVANNTLAVVEKLVANKETDEAVVESDYIVVKAKSAPEPVALTSVVLSTTTVEYGTTTAPTATVKAGETTVDAANYDISYSTELTATTAVGTEITVTATAKGTDYKGSASATFTVVAKAVTPAITLSATTAEFSDTLALPTVTVDGYTLDTDYTVAWDKSLPTVNPAEDVVLTVTVTMKGNYTGSNTATFTVTPKAAGPTRPTDIEGGSADQIAAYDKWAAGKDLTGKTDAQIIDAFILNADVTATAAQLEEKLGAEITSEMVAALAAGETADFTALKEKYPNATFEFVEYTEIETTATLYKLTAKFVPANAK